MPGKINQLVICLIAVASIVILTCVSQLFKVLSNNETNSQYSWFIKLTDNLFGYLIIIVPGYLILKYVQLTNYIDVAATGVIPGLIRRCFAEPPPPHELLDGNATKSGHSSSRTALKLTFCVVGLLVAYLTWGFLQEKVMTKEYVDILGNTGKFKDSQFLVFVNRILAFLIAAIYLTFTADHGKRTLPMYKYMLCSLSNILSSFCQYEALKYVTFPLQVLAKASKVIPVMIMGKCISRKKYDNYEYITAVMISLGMALFLLGQEHQQVSGKHAAETTLPGVILLLGYLVCDSFTSNWQGQLFSQYKVSSVQMMLGVNMFSCLLTSTSLLEQGAFKTAFDFMSQYPNFIFDCLILSVCSAVGQLFIFYTISEFGAVTFVIIMTVRQGLAILLSCIYYGHDIHLMGSSGVAIVFIAVFLRIYCSHRLKQLRQRKQQQASTV